MKKTSLQEALESVVKKYRAHHATQASLQEKVLYYEGACA